MKIDELIECLNMESEAAYNAENLILRDTLDEAAETIRVLNAVPAADVVEVVRCKDCKYCKVECGNYCCYVDDYLKMPTPHYGDFYCADGEWREVQDG